MNLFLKVSVVIPNYNYAHFLSETVHSVLNQSYKNLECIIVDDGSTDNSALLIKQFAEKDQRVKPIFKSNGGLSSARNAGIKAATGDLIAFLDADDVWMADKIANQINVFIKYPNVNFAFSNYIAFYTDGRKESFTHEFGDIHPFDFIRQNPIAGSASSAILSKTLIDKVGFFDESLRSTEDHEYWFRCLLAGAVFKFCNYHDVLLREHKGSMSGNIRRMTYFNYLVFSRQLKLFPLKWIQENSSVFYDNVNIKITSLLWKARDTYEFVLITKLYFLAFQFLPFNIFAKQFLYKHFRYDFTLWVKNGV